MRHGLLLCLTSALVAQAPPPAITVLPTHVNTPPAEAIRTASGLAYQVTHAGQEGAHPGEKGFVLVHFSGWDATGKPFANTRANGEPIYLNLERIMPGMREALQAMTVGEVRRLWIPENLAFAGAKGRPAGAVTMELELLEIPPPPSQAPEDVAAPGAGAQLLRSGLAFKLLRPGTGKVHPTYSSTVSVHYTGWTTDGKLFDSSIPKGSSVSLQLKHTIEGWIEGLPLMVVGERRRFWIPQKLAYRGDAGKPAGTLVFDIELVALSQ